jgi:ABC-type spermidine/putrescine transport system permease subunit I
VALAAVRAGTGHPDPGRLRSAADRRHLFLPDARPVRRRRWEFSTEGWFRVFFTRDIFDDTVSFAGAHLDIFWRSVSLALYTTVLTAILGFPTAWFIATRPPHGGRSGCS